MSDAFNKFMKKGLTSLQIMVAIAAIAVVSIVVLKFVEVDSKEEEKVILKPYEITTKNFGIFYIEAFSSDPNYGYGEYLDQGLKKLEREGYKIQDTAPVVWRNNQVKTIWVRTRKN